MDGTRFRADSLYDEVKNLMKATDEIYIYGSGLYGQNIQALLEKRGIYVNGFVVTTGAENQKAKLTIINIEKVIHKNIGLIIGMNPQNAREAKEYLRSCRFNMQKVVDGGIYLDKTDKREDGYEAARLGITTKIGCKINCKYCPQDILLKRYFENNQKRIEFMSVNTFEKCLSKTPQNCIISFSGMAEPFLNPDCMAMLRMACQSGRRVELYTTLVGAAIEDIRELLKLPMYYVTLHVADKLQYANIPVTDEYLEKVTLLAKAEKEDGTPFINLCNAQAEPDERVLEALGEKYEVLTSLFDRAGNLESEMLISRKTPQGSIFCTMCGKQLNHNELLPDGTVVLCCMDYGMKHVLGNLLQDTYEEIVHGKCVEYVKRGMEKDFDADILCRQCSLANLAKVIQN